MKEHIYENFNSRTRKLQKKKKERKTISSETFRRQNLFYLIFNILSKIVWVTQFSILKLCFATKIDKPQSWKNTLTDVKKHYFKHHFYTIQNLAGQCLGKGSFFLRRNDFFWEFPWNLKKLRNKRKIYRPFYLKYLIVFPSP